MTLATGGSVVDAIKSAAFAFAQIHAFSYVGAVLGDVGLAGNYLAKGLVHGVVGGAMSMAQGGGFVQGFAGSAIGAVGGMVAGESGLVGSYGDGITELQLARAAISAVAGCAASAAVGGKCAPAAVTAAFASLYNGDKGGGKNWFSELYENVRDGWRSYEGRELAGRVQDALGSSEDMEWRRRTTAVVTLKDDATIDGHVGVRHLIATSYEGGFTQLQRMLIEGVGNAHIVPSIPSIEGNNLHHAEYRVLLFAYERDLPGVSLAINPRPSCPACTIAVMKQFGWGRNGSIVNY